MLSLSPSQRIFLALEPVDMRKHFDGLWALASEKLQEDPFGGAWFVFTNKDWSMRIKTPHQCRLFLPMV